MDTITSLWIQLNTLCFYLHRNTNLDITLLFNDDCFHLNIKNNNGENIYTVDITGFKVKSEKVLEFDLRQTISYLIELKNLKSK